MDNLSQASFKSGMSNNSQFKIPHKVYMDGESFDGEYLTKSLTLDGKIVVNTPENIKNKVTGDKVAVVRYMVIFEPNLPDRPDLYVFVARAVRQRNNFDSHGMQTDVIGYGIYNPQIGKFQLDSQFFEVDSVYPVTIQLYIQKIGTNQIEMYQPSKANPDMGQPSGFIYYDIQTTYNFL